MTPGSGAEADRKSILAHYERYLGETVGGWSQDAAGVRLPFDVVRFDNAPHAGASTFATVGLSEVALRSPRKAVRMELVLAAPGDAPAVDAVRVIVRVGEEMLARRQALLRGDLVKLTDTRSVYASVPVYYPDGMSQFNGVAVCWLFAVFDSEAQYVKQRGWEAFESRLVDADPDLVDPGRSPVV